MHAAYSLVYVLLKRHEKKFNTASVVLVNPLTTDDECTRHETLAACYQLAQSVLKIGFALAKKVG